MTSSAPDTFRMPGTPPCSVLTLWFDDRAIERQYSLYQLSSSTVRLRLSLIAAAVLMGVFVPVDLLLLHPPVELTLFRGVIVVPLALVGVWASYSFPRVLFPVAAVTGTIATAGFPAAVIATGDQELSTFASLAMMQCMLFMAAIMVLPFTMVFGGCLLSIGLMLIALASVSSPQNPVVNYMVATLMTTGLSVFIAYTREKTHRRLFVRREQLKVLVAEQVQSQDEQIDWLRNLPASLERDMQTQLFEIEGQLEQLLDEPPVAPAVVRAHAQIRTLMSMFETARYASSVAVSAPETHPVELASLLENVVVERSRYLVDALQVRLDTPAEVWVRADEAWLRQAVEQIFNGAALRVRDDETVDVSIQQHDGRALVDFRIDRDFGPPVSDAASRPSSLGLSFYLANRILTNCGGRLDVMRADGATIFRAILPLVSERADAPVPTYPVPGDASAAPVDVDQPGSASR